MDLEAIPEFLHRSPDELRELYRNDPGRFDEMAADAIKEACVGRTPEQTLKLRQMQWAIDANLRKGKTPLQRMHIMENIFYGRVFGADGHLAKLVAAYGDFFRAMGGITHLAGKKPTLRLLKK